MTAPFFLFLALRVLMVWVYGHTQSVLLALLMHLSIDVMTFSFASPARVGVPDLIFNLVFAWPRSRRPTAECSRVPSLMNLVRNPSTADEREEGPGARTLDMVRR